MNMGHHYENSGAHDARPQHNRVRRLLSQSIHDGWCLPTNCKYVWRISLAVDAVVRLVRNNP